MNDVALYDRMIAAGESQAIADICASRRAPGEKGTDHNFLQHRVLHHGFETKDLNKEEFIKAAQDAGISIAGKIYVGGLADGRGPTDPRAWVSDTSDLLSVCRERNLTCNGVVKHRGHQTAPEPSIPLAEDLIEEEMRAMIAANPDLAHGNLAELRESIIDRCAPKWPEPEPYKKPLSAKERFAE